MMITMMKVKDLIAGELSSEMFKSFARVTEVDIKITNVNFCNTISVAIIISKMLIL